MERVDFMLCSEKFEFIGGDALGRSAHRLHAPIGSGCFPTGCGVPDFMLRSEKFQFSCALDPIYSASTFFINLEAVVIILQWNVLIFAFQLDKSKIMSSRTILGVRPCLVVGR